MWCEGSLFWNAVSPITCPHTRGDGCGTWHDLPALVFLVFRLWPTRKRTPACCVDARGTAPVALTPPIRAISILSFTIITTIKSAGIPGVVVVGPEGCSLTAIPSSSWDLCCSLIDLHGHAMLPEAKLHIYKSAVLPYFQYCNLQPANAS